MVQGALFFLSPSLLKQVLCEQKTSLSFQMGAIVREHKESHLPESLIFYSHMYLYFRKTIYLAFEKCSLNIYAWSSRVSIS